MNVNIPAAYTDENATPANKAVYKEFQRVITSIKESAKVSRGGVWDLRLDHANGVETKSL